MFSDLNKDATKSLSFNYNLGILIILYFLQGFPLGLADIFPYIIQTLGASYKDLALFSVTTWPFSLKILWAPIVDGIYINKIGQRKTWIFVTQLSIGLALMYLSSKVDYYFLNLKTGAVLKQLVFMFTFLTFLAATQDIAVDGWGLNLFPRSLVSYASFANTVGQTIGYLFGNVLFLLFTSPINLPFLESKVELVSESKYIYYFGVLFIFITIFVLIFKHEPSVEPSEHSMKETIIQSYHELGNYVKQPFMIKITIMLVTLRFCTAALDSLVYPKLVEFGLKREDYGILSIPLIIVQICTSFIANIILKDRNPVPIYMKFLPLKLLMQVFSMAFIYYVKTIQDQHFKFMISVALFSLITGIINSFTYSAMMYLFSLMINPQYAGSQLTYLNTINNLAWKWPQILVLYLVDNLTIKTCTLSNDAQICTTRIDGYHVVASICLVYGVLWYWKFKKQFIHSSFVAIRNVDNALNKQD